MSTELAKQLKKIEHQTRLNRGVIAGLKKRPSFIFDEKEAADYDTETIYSIGYEGFMELCKVDKFLRDFEERFFSTKLVEQDLTLLTEKEWKEYKDPMRVFLTLLSPYFLERSCHKALEWMIRKWRVNEVFVDELMICILPYHETKEFVRMVQTIFFTQNTIWSFLFEKVKQNASPVNRSLLSQRCVVEPKILALLMKSFDDLHTFASDHREYAVPSLMISFIVHMNMEVIMATPKLEEPRAISLFQSLEPMIKDNLIPEASVGALMIFLCLVEKINVTEEAINYFLRKVTAIATEATVRNVILAYIRVIEAGYIDKIATGDAVNLVSLPGFQQQLMTISKQFHFSSFIKVLIDTLKQDESQSMLVASLEQSIVVAN